jgi:tRNA-Thr(GGU) m(6)t(6)A37 methyltransferase TsaA
LGLFRYLRSLVTERSSPVSTEPVCYRPIGVVRNRAGKPRTQGWGSVVSHIILRDELGEALNDLDGFSHVIVVFHMHRVPESERRVKLPIGGSNAPERGVLATRSQLRPNPIGVCVAELQHRRKNVLRVRGLDALDGTPVLDLKPYLPPYDSAPNARLPRWALEDEPSQDATRQGP